MIESTAGERGAPALLAGKYRLEREVGRGGMGVVYQATHVALRLRVAIKVVLPELAENPLVIQRVLREARCAAQIAGDHVVRVIDVGQLDSGQPFIVMEYVDGEDLAKRLAQHGRLSLHAAVHALLEASVAIAEAHAKGIVHRDLKPANLFVARGADGREWIKVLDFGISKQLDGERPVTRPNDVMGSPNYMAPEQICTPLAVDARADIWALGAILVELATGQRAFPGDTITAVYTRVLTGEPALPEPGAAELPHELVSIVSRCLRKEPAERFQSVHELVAALAPFASSVSTPALRAIARFERTALEAGGSETATSPPSPFASNPPGSGRVIRRAPPGARSVRRVAAGVGLGLALSAAALGPWPAWSALELRAEPWHGWLEALRARGAGATASPVSAPEARPVASPPVSPPRSSWAALAEPSALVRVAPATPAARGEGQPSRSGGADAGEPEAAERAALEVAPPEPAAPWEAAQPAASVEPSAGHPRPRATHDAPPPEAGGATAAERSRITSAPPLEAPLRNPWDVTTFGGRS